MITQAQDIAHYVTNVNEISNTTQHNIQEENCTCGYHSYSLQVSILITQIKIIDK